MSGNINKKKNDLSALFRLEFYKKQSKWKLSHERKNAEANAAVTENNSDVTYHLNTDFPISDDKQEALNNDFLNEGPELETSPAQSSKTTEEMPGNNLHRQGHQYQANLSDEQNLFNYEMDNEVLPNEMYVSEDESMWPERQGAAQPCPQPELDDEVQYWENSNVNSDVVDDDDELQFDDPHWCSPTLDTDLAAAAAGDLFPGVRPASGFACPPHLNLPTGFDQPPGLDYLPGLDLAIWRQECEELEQQLGQLPSRQHEWLADRVVSPKPRHTSVSGADDGMAPVRGFAEFCQGAHAARHSSELDVQTDASATDGELGCVSNTELRARAAAHITALGDLFTEIMARETIDKGSNVNPQLQFPLEVGHLSMRTPHILQNQCGDLVVGRGRGRLRSERQTVFTLTMATQHSHMQ